MRQRGRAGLERTVQLTFWTGVVIAAISVASFCHVFAEEHKDRPRPDEARFPASSEPVLFSEINPPALILLDEAETASLKRRLDSDPASRAAFTRDALTLAEESLAREPSPLREIVYEGRVSGDPARVDTIRHLADMPRISALAWSARVTGDDRYRTAAIKWTLAWVQTCPPSGNDVNDNKLDAILLATQLLGDQMRQSDRETCSNWIRLLAQRQAEGFPRAGANRLAKRIKLVAAAGVILKDRSLVDAAAAQFKAYVDSQLHGDGTSEDFRQRDALQYHVSGLKNMLEAALLLKKAGLDLYAYQSPGGASVAHSVHWVNPYATGEKTHLEWVNTKVDLDRRRWAAGDEEYRPGRPWEPASSLRMYQMALALDPQLESVVASLRRRSAEPVNWQDVLLWTTRTASGR